VDTLNKKITVVLGMHRSGTSAIARGIVELGAHPGNNLLPENEGNPKGYWEDANIVNLNETILKGFNMRWHSLDNPMINRFENLLPLYEEKYLEEAINIVNNNFELSNSILIKDPRISILLPFWEKVFQIVGADVKYVLALRNPLETAKSLLKRNRIETEQGINLWTYYNFMILKNIQSDLLVCSFSFMLNNSIEELKRVSSYIESDKSNADLEGYCSDFLDNSLKHYNEDVERLKELLGENHVSVTLFDNLYRWSKQDKISKNEINDFTCRYLEPLTQSLGFSNNEHIDNYVQVFINTGEGFSEKDSYKYDSNATTNSVDINVGDNLVEEIRFDPSNYSCMLIINSIEFVGTGELIDYELLSGNYQYKYNDIYIFENEDPQIIIKPINVNFTKVRIDFSVFSIDAHTHTLLSNIKSQENNQLKIALNSKEQKINKKQEEIEAIDEIVENKEQELIEVVQEIEEKDQKLSEMVKEVEDKENQIINYQTELNVKDNIIENKEQEISKVLNEIEDKENQISKMDKEIKAKNQMIENKEQELNIKNQEMIFLEEQFNTTTSEISVALEMMNEREALKYRMFSLYLIRVLKNIVKILVYPNRRLRLLYNKRILQKHRAFNGKFYLFKNRDLIHSNVDLVEHFIEVGWKEGRSPNPSFNMELYLQQDRNCIVENRNPIITKIKNEMKVYKTLKKSKYFDGHYYFSNYSDIEEQNTDPIKHYIEHGYKEGRNPSEYFDTQFYLNTYNDINEAGINPLWHYITYGQYEGRLPHESYVRKLSTFDELVFKINKLYYFKKSANISVLDTLKFIRNRGFKGFFQKIRYVLNGTEGSLRKHITSYEYSTPDIDEKVRTDLSNFELNPKISIIMPVYNVQPKWLELAIKSVEKQWYSNWELCIVDDCSTNKSTINYLKKLKSDRIKLKFLSRNLNISGASNKALEMVTGEYILLMDNDDEVTVDALYEIVKEINVSGADFIYSDEDKIEEDGSYCEPHYKPDYSPDMILSQNYISHIGVIKKALIENVGGFTIGFEGAQDYDLYLKVLEQTNSVKHIPKVLYHWRKIPGSTASEYSDKSYAQEAGRLAVENAMKRRKQNAIVHNGKFPGTYRVKYEIVGNPLVSIIIPFKDRPELLKMCIESILAKSTYEKYEIIGISNNSDSLETFEEMKRLASVDSRVRFQEYNIPFNYSKINNYAVEEFAKGEHIILLNNDIEIITEGWIESMLELSQREDIGVVGAKLYYPNNTLQHAGVIIGIGGIAGHSHKYFPIEDHGYFCRPHIIQNLSGVTAACLMVKKSLYKNVSGLDESNLSVAFNDVDFCLRIKERGLNNVYTPYAEAYHHESISRGLEDNPEKVERFQSEIDYMKKRHAQILENGDPYYNLNLSLAHEDFSLR
jgi:glycosyltransferase involved in cell wall biosynthesis